MHELKFLKRPAEIASDTLRHLLDVHEPKCLRTYTPTQVVIRRGHGSLLETVDGKVLFDFTSGVLVANLGHNPSFWLQRYGELMGWPTSFPTTDEYISAVPMTTYNAATPLEAVASQRLLDFVERSPGSGRLTNVLWAASGSEAVQKALWACLAWDRTRPMIVATRHGFHGKKGLAGAVSGSEHDAERDPRVQFVSFPMKESQDLDRESQAFDPSPYIAELESLVHRFGRRIGTFVTEPYLGGGGSFHPPLGYLKAIQEFCHRHEILFVLDEVQSNFGRTGTMFAFEKYELEPDLVVLGKGLGNGVPTAAVVGRADVFASLGYGEGSDTWSGNPLTCAAVVATLEEFERRDVLASMQESSAGIRAGLVELKQHPFVAHVRGESGGMVWGIEMRDFASRSAAGWAEQFVLAAYLGDGDRGVHLLGPLAKKVIRISPPLTIAPAEARQAIAILHQAAARLTALAREAA